MTATSGKDSFGLKNMLIKHITVVKLRLSFIFRSFPGFADTKQIFERLVVFKKLRELELNLGYLRTEQTLPTTGAPPPAQQPKFSSR